MDPSSALVRALAVCQSDSWLVLLARHSCRLSLVVPIQSTHSHNSMPALACRRSGSLLGLCSLEGCGLAGSGVGRLARPRGEGLGERGADGGGIVGWGSPHRRLKALTK